MPTDYVHQLDNGLVLLGEPSDAFQSAAFSLLISAGCRHDPAGQAGLASLSCEMMLRGAGDRDSRQLISDLENLGVEPDIIVEQELNHIRDGIDDQLEYAVRYLLDQI